MTTPGSLKVLVTDDFNWVTTMLSQPIKSSLSNIIIFTVLNFLLKVDEMGFFYVTSRVVSVG